MRVHLVFVNEQGEYGNSVGITLDAERKIGNEERQKITKKTGFSECVFVDDLESRVVSIYNPEREVEFAGHALVGTAYYLRKLLGDEVGEIKCRAGLVKVRADKDKIWIEAKLEVTPPWILKEMDGPDEIDDMAFGFRRRLKHAVVWAWIDKDMGLIRARTFAPDWGIPEDEANGSGAMQLAIHLGRELEIHHGKGSVIYARPLGENTAEVGGRVESHE